MFKMALKYNSISKKIQWGNEEINYYAIRRVISNQMSSVSIINQNVIFNNPP